MKYEEAHLNKLITFIKELTHDPDNDSFKTNLYSILYDKSGEKNTNPLIAEIYEYCISIIVKEQAENFYKDFALPEIGEKLISDFIRMERFRRENNFEDFCLALFQQLEAIVNALLSEQLRQYLNNHIEDEVCKIRNKVTRGLESYKLWQLLFYPHLESHQIENKISRPILEWDFAERFKAILFVYYFDKKIYNYYDFTSIYFLGDELYQSRNLNHRGIKRTEKQEKVISKVKNEYNRYYFKFLGFLEDFTSTINQTLAKGVSL